MSTQDDVIGLIAEVLEQSPDEISPGDHFLEDLGASSFDIVTLVMRIEQHYALGETPDEALGQIATVGDVVGLVQSVRQGEGGAAAASEGLEVVDVAIASDHAGVELKAALIEWFRRRGFTFVDLGPASGVSVDYPDFASLVAERVVEGGAERGVLICGTGIGMSLAANKVKGIRAALVSEPVSAELSRQHNDANVLCLGARMIGEVMAQRCVERFMTTRFDPGDDGRHRRRVQRIQALEG